MTRKHPPAKWVLPAIIDPPRRRCFTIEVPDERFHVAAFRGALLNLASAINWQDDTAHTAREVALVWREIVDNVFDCIDCETDFGIDTGENDMNLRISPDNPCIIQTLCGDGTWMDWYNPEGCIPSAAAQHGPVSQPEVGECLEYDVKLDGSGYWHLPVPVSSGDTIEITDATGGWYDGGLSAWRCPNGQAYGFGLCADPTITEGGDPLPASPHMMLIASINGVFHEAYNTTITVPTGLSLQDMVFQPNDDPLTDNAGSISFHVKYCHNVEAPVGDCLFDDFRVSDGGWAHVGAVSVFGTYVMTGTKHWRSDYSLDGLDQPFEQLRLFKAYTGHVSTVRVKFDVDQPGYFLFHNDASLPDAFHAIYLQQVVVGNNQEITVDIDADVADNIRFDFAHDLDATDNHFRVYEIEVCP